MRLDAPSSDPFFPPLPCGVLAKFFQYLASYIPDVHSFRIVVHPSRHKPPCLVHVLLADFP